MHINIAQCTGLRWNVFTAERRARVHPRRRHVGAASENSVCVERGKFFISLVLPPAAFDGQRPRDVPSVCLLFANVSHVRVC